MIFGSVCDGISGAACAWVPLGWRPAWRAEIDPFANAVAEVRWPDVPNLGDFTKIGRTVDCDAIDLLAGGTPCQDFSFAGKRAGLDAPRGNLTLEYLGLAQRLRPDWLVWENVPGVLSLDDGRAFGTILGTLGELGYGWAYRKFDARYFGLAQRRGRIFLVGYLGDWRPAAQVLFEPEGLSGHPAPRREKGAQLARPLASCPAGGSGIRNDPDTAENLIASTLGGKGHCRQDHQRDTYVAHTLPSEGYDASEDGTGRGAPIVAVAPPLTGNHYGDNEARDGLLVPMAFSCKNFAEDAGELAPTLRAMEHDKSHANSGGQDPIFSAESPPLASDLNSAAVAYSVRTSQTGANGLGVAEGEAHTLDTGNKQAVAYGGNNCAGPIDVATTCQSHAGPHGRQDFESETFVVAQQPAAAFAENSRAEVRLEGGDGQITGTLSTRGGKIGQAHPAIVEAVGVSLRGREGGSTAELGGPVSNALRTAQGGGDKQHILHEMRVRRLTPLEWERLQGFPDHYTRIAWGRKPVERCPDGPRYRALGNAFPVPVVRWIGRRLAAVDKSIREAK